MLVTGGSGSIGRVIARQALAAGWRVALHGSSAASAEAVVATLPDGAKGFGADLIAPGGIERLVEDAATWGGRLDAVVDCATTGRKGAKIAGLFEGTDPDAYADFLTLSLGNLQRLAHAALPWLKRQGGTLVAFVSDAGKFAAPRQAMIGASRAGMMGFVRNLATEVARDGVRVHCVSPSFVAQSAVAERLAEVNAARVEAAAKKAGLGLPTPEDIAPLVLFLCGDGARRITGQVISVNGGMNA